MRYLIISLSFLGCFYAWGAETETSTSYLPAIEKVLLNFGSHTEFYNAVQINESGETRKFQIAPTIGAGVSLPLEYGWRFLPEFNWVLPFKQGSRQVIKNLFMLRADFGHDPFKWLRLRIGTSLMILNQHGLGGSTKIKNGNTTSTFYYPDENHSSINNTFDLGAEYLYQNWSLRLQTYTYSLFQQERRQLSYTLFVSYYLDK
jgi:hypothetical protein